MIINEGFYKDNYIKKIKKSTEYDLDTAIKKNDMKTVKDIRDKCIKAIKYVNDSKKMKTVDRYISVKEWIIWFIIYALGFIYINTGALTGRTKFTKEELNDIEKILNNSLEKCNKFLEGNIKHESTILVEAAKNPIIIRESSLSKDIKIENKSDLDDKDVDRILNKHYKNIIKETEKYIDKQYDLMYDKDNPAPMSLKDCKKLISEKIYNVDVRTMNTPKHGDVICFEISIDLGNAFSGHILNCDYYISADSYKYIRSEFSMNG